MHSFPLRAETPRIRLGAGMQRIAAVRLGAGMQRVSAVRLGAGMHPSAPVRLGAGMQPAATQHAAPAGAVIAPAIVPACVADAGRVRLGAGMQRG